MKKEGWKPRKKPISSHPTPSTVLARCDKSNGAAGFGRINLPAMSDSTGASPAPPSAPPIPTHSDLFLTFLKITVMGFGGTLPWTRRMFVEEKHWMTAEEFNDAYALCQFLPGPNIVNLTAVFG